MGHPFVVAVAENHKSLRQAQGRLLASLRMTWVMGNPFVACFDNEMTIG
jgi:hypothetical protein